MQKFWKKNKKSLPAGRKGLTLVETILAVAVLSITIMASTAVSSSYLRSRMSIKKYQANNEELSLALNYLAKDIRMSHTNGVASPDEYRADIYPINNSTTALVEYKFNSGNKTLTRNGIVIASNVTGNFYVANNTKGIPRITITIKKEGTPEMVVQTTVSMRSMYKDTL
ncbi:MAG: hypothetical protein WCK16_04775 [Candidatus Moraniibacteriota bacterium]